MVLTPDAGYDLKLESILVMDGEETEVEYQTAGPEEDGAVTLTFLAAETDMLVRAEAAPWPRYHVNVTAESLEEGGQAFDFSVEPEDLYEGADVTVSVNYTGSQIWTATATYGDESADLDFTVSGSSVTFVMPASDVEAVSYTHLSWKKERFRAVDLDRAERILDEDHYGLKRIKRRIIQQIAAMRLKKKQSGSILLFVGPPGTGKTSIGQSIAKALGRKYVRISLGGIRDEAEIRGHRRTYICLLYTSRCV